MRAAELLPKTAYSYRKYLLLLLAKIYNLPVVAVVAPKPPKLGAALETVGWAAPNPNAGFC